ncbi:CPA_1a_G0035320.mRNA.1.CDS.1 [Saccharomyces cerevisiae]|nr:CPA_1a_G0035320.mRNA.1.CDS.1 [Saccharomyces cerevisiae]CAI7401931.1 CPA_1a_G0035320.mRNA.1.CDS.1 [Saccharomyces cerevisiae]
MTETDKKQEQKTTRSARTNLSHVAFVSQKRRSGIHASYSMDKTLKNARNSLKSTKSA